MGVACIKPHPSGYKYFIIEFVFIWSDLPLSGQAERSCAVEKVMPVTVKHCFVSKKKSRFLNMLYLTIFGNLEVMDSSRSNTKIPQT